jgi:putative membrane protein
MPALIAFVLAMLAAGSAHGHAALRDPNEGAGAEAVVVIVIVLAVFWYTAGLRRVWPRVVRGRRELAYRAISFAAGLAMTGAALLSPLDRWGAQLFAMHMIQHELLMLVAAPLLVAGRPLPLFLWAFGDASRTLLVRVTQWRGVRVVWVALLSPIIAWLLHALVLWVWHVPAFFDAVLRSEPLHDVQHFTFLVSALAFWASMIEARRPDQQGAAVLYLFTTTVHTSILGALITFAGKPWFSAYLQIPRDWGLTALEDQQLGGLIMWVPGGLVYVGVALALLVRWLRTTDSLATSG